MAEYEQGNAITSRPLLREALSLAVPAISQKYRICFKIKACASQMRSGRFLHLLRWYPVV